MTAEPLQAVVQYLHRVLGAKGGNLTDAELLAYYVQGREPRAFEALVRRHSPLVLGVCRRVLGNVSEVDDAYQATFLVFARKAAGMRKKESVGSWLTGVAHHM